MQTNDRPNLTPPARPKLTLRATRAHLAALLRNPLVGYPTALFAVTAAALLTSAFYVPFFTRNQFALFYAAVVLTAWVGGTGPGLLASAAAVVAINYFLSPSFATTWTEVGVGIGTFGSVAILVSSLNARRRRAERDLRQAKDAAEQANAAKDQFLAMLSHELRTPLTPVLTAAQVMTADRSLPPDAQETVDMIRRNVELEARLIDDLLDLTRIANGKIQLNPQPVETHCLVENVLDICRSDTRAKRIAIATDLQATHTHLHADPARLQQVLWNLLKNATKFTPEGGTITVHTRNDDQSLVIEVQDTGIGIPPTTLPKIFDAFEQGGTQINRRFGGLGLGLAITKSLIDMHNGTITAHSDGPGTGSTFSVRLPTIPAPVPAPREPSPRPASAVDQSLRLLLVEDHADTARVMARLLKSWQYEVLTAGSVQAALQTAATERFDLVISDLGLPDGNGIELMSDLRRLYNLRGIALTGHGMEDDVRRCHEAGFLTHLTKPVNIDTLRGVIQQVLS